MDYDYYVGIDIGSTGSKVAVIDGKSLVYYFNFPTGWNSKETANEDNLPWKRCLCPV